MCNNPLLGVMPPLEREPRWTDGVHSIGSKVLWVLFVENDFEGLLGFCSNISLCLNQVHTEKVRSWMMGWS